MEKCETTLARAKEVSSVAEHLIALAVRTYDKTIELKKETKNDKQQIVVLDVVNDAPEKLAARRQIMRTLYEIPATRGADEDKDDFLARQKAVKHPVVEKLFREHAPKYRARQQEKGHRRWLYPHHQEGPAPWRRGRDGHSRAGVKNNRRERNAFCNAFRSLFMQFNRCVGGLFCASFGDEREMSIA